MGDAKFWDTNYGKTLDELKLQIKAINSATGKDLDEKISSANATVRRLQGIKRNYNLEIKLLRDLEAKATFSEEKAVKDSILADLESELEDISNKHGGSDRGSLFSGNQSDQGTSEVSGNDKLDMAEEIQNKTENKYKNIIRVLEDTEEVGGVTSMALQSQREKIKKITDTVIEMDSLLGRSNKLIKVYSRRLATDKFIQCFSCLNVSLFVAIIMYLVITQVGTKKSSG